MADSFDKELVGKLDRLRVEAENLQAQMREPQSGLTCACGRLGMCAFHATVWNALDDAARGIGRAAKHMRKYYQAEQNEVI
jgi:hypothetical protein